MAVWMALATRTHRVAINLGNLWLRADSHYRVAHEAFEFGDQPIFILGS